MIKIKPAELRDASSLRNLPPAEWFIKLDELFLVHFNNDYFYSVIAEIDNEVIGFGNLIINELSAWFGNIVVNKNYQRQKIGTNIINHLQNHLDEKKIDSRILIATREGKALYKTLGFTEKEDYQFYRGQCKSSNNINIMPISTEDYEGVFNLDKIITGENRRAFLQQFIGKSFIYKKDGAVNGFCIPNIGSGPVYALDEEAGSALMKYKHSNELCASVVPKANKDALMFFRYNSFDHFGEAVRMYYGKDVNWMPDKVFSRMFAYSG
jgi:N-acetylglutamate synthase-like GNAT family acetyltransferase